MEMRVDGGKGGGSQWPSAAGDASGHGGGDGPQVWNSIHSYTIDAAWMASMAGGAAGELGSKGSRGLRRRWRRRTPGVGCRTRGANIQASNDADRIGGGTKGAGLVADAKAANASGGGGCKCCGRRRRRAIGATGWGGELMWVL